MARQFTAAEVEQINDTLATPLSRECVSSRPAPGGGRVVYVEAHHTFNFANNVFGADGW
eukprot:SAG31_NODE_40390_length_281_cov_0.582418_1_plen_58_part_01